MLKTIFPIYFLRAAVVFAQAPSATNFGGQPGTLLSNGKLQLVVLDRITFPLFYAHVPEGFGKVDIELQNGQIVIEDHTAQKKITLAASRGL